MSQNISLESICQLYFIILFIYSKNTINFKKFSTKESAAKTAVNYTANSVTNSHCKISTDNYFRRKESQ